jgi:hypothetical protein
MRYTSRVITALISRTGLGACSVLLCGSVAWAEGVTVSGTVQDAGGSPLGAARLSLSSDVGETREAESDGNGRFAFDDVAPGKYVVRVQASTHLPLEMPLQVTTQPPRPLRIQMKLGIDEEVTVEDVTPEQERTAAANNGDTLSLHGDFIQGLPTAPGAQGLTDLVSSFVSPAAQGTGGASILVDGAEDSALTIPSDAIRRIKVNRDPYSTEYRRPGKGRIEILTQDGSRRRFKGGAAFTWRTSAFDARNALSGTRQEVNRRSLQMSFGGPLWKKPGAHGAGSFFLGAEYLTGVEDRIVAAQTVSGPLSAAIPARDRLMSGLARADLRSGLHRASLRYYYASESSTNRHVGGLRLPEQGYDGRDGPEHTVQAAGSFISSRYINDVQFTLAVRKRREGRPAHGPALDVNGAFLGGEPQVDRAGDRTRLELRNVGTVVLGPHTFRFGAGARRDALTETDASGFGGIFEFASLADFSRARPFVYRVSRGTPRLSLVSWETEAFAQDEIKLGSPLRLMVGARYDRSSEIHDRDNVAPRLAVAYSPGSQKSVFRAGFGVFYERLPSWVSERRLLEDGARVRSLVVVHPSYPDPFRAGETSVVPPSVFRTAANLETPYTVQASAAWERQLGRWTVMTLEYAFLRGYHLFRARDVNAPLPGTGLRPDPSLRNVVEIGSSGRMRSHALTFTYRGTVGRHFKATAQYTLAQTRNDVPGAGADPLGGTSLGLPADNYDLEKEYGRADFDRRHQVSLAGLLELPLRIQIGALLRYKSPIPFDITTGRDDNGDTYANDRPPGVRRNAGRGPRFTQLDLRLTKQIRTASPFPGDKRRRGSVQMVLDAFNVLNQVNYGPYVGVVTSPFFGRAVAAKEPRAFQFAVRYGF